MKQLLLILLLVPIFTFPQTQTNGLEGLKRRVQLLEKSKYQSDSLHQNTLADIKSRSEYQEKSHQQALDNISAQFDAASYNLGIFGVLFAIAAVAMGAYITYVERKVVNLREENKSLLDQTIKTKDEVVSINTLIQKDIYGLFLKIKREETVHLLNRLLAVPNDVSNLSSQLLSRELERGDFMILKEAYLKLDKASDGRSEFMGMTHSETYKLLFFQHFLDLTIKDEQLGPEMVSFYPHGIECAFENDIIKATEDFVRALVDSGVQTREKEIDSFMKGLARSHYKNFDKVYKILFQGLRSRDDKFKFLRLIADDETCRIAKINFGNLLITEYSEIDLTQSESEMIERIKEMQAMVNNQSIPRLSQSEDEVKA